MMRVNLSVMSAISLLIVACGCAANGVSSGMPTWHGCAGRFECATVLVPLWYSEPRGRRIQISVVRLVASGPHPIGDVVFNPGGPGESGVRFLERAWRTFPASLRARFTLVSFDPRGVGSSEPLQCLTVAGRIAYLGRNPAPKTPKQINEVVRADRRFVHGCEDAATTAFISSMSTANNARDMDRLRIALGQKRLTYFGFSYGTYLGTVYAEMFPKHIRAMVLDGAVDPSLSVATVAAQADAALERDLHDFLDWCARQSSCANRFSTSPAKAYQALFAHFEHGLVIPAYLGLKLGREHVNYGIAALGVLSTLETKSAWPFLGKALAQATNGDGVDLAESAYSQVGLDPYSPSNVLSASTATGCLDPPAPPTISKTKMLARQLSKTSPDFGGAVWGGLTCLYWPGHSQRQPAPAHAPGAPPILVIGSTGDPFTPYTWAQSLAKQLPRANLLTRAGDGHTAYPFSSCVRRWADRYLETLEMPPARTICPSDDNG